MNTSSSNCRKPALSKDDVEKIRALLPASVLLLAAPVDDWMSAIHPEERAIVRGAVPVRQAEFSTGRMLAARGCRQLGASAAPILRGEMNEPLWPGGVTGSITHTRDFCLVAVAPSKTLPRLGIDLEASQRSVGKLARLILRPDEQQVADDLWSPPEDRVRLVFAAKESLYKAVHARAGRFIDFQEVRIDFGPGNDTFSATAPDDSDLNVLVKAGSGRYRVAENAVFTAWFDGD